MDRYSLMQTFVRVAETGSVSAAARDLRLGQPAISKHLQALESLLNAQLLLRSPQGVRLTEPGRRYYERAKRLLEDVHELESDFSESGAGPLRGRLRIRAPVTLGELHLARLIGDFAKLHAQLELDLTLSDQGVGLLEAGVDVAIVLGRLADSNYVARRLAVLQRVLVGSAGYLQRAGVPTRIDELAGHEFIRLNAAGEGDVLAFGSAGERQSVRTRGRIQVNNGLALRELLLAGHGLSALPRTWVDADIAAGSLHCVLAEHELDGLELHALYPSARFLPTRVRALIRYLQERLSALPGLR